MTGIMIGPGSARAVSVNPAAKRRLSLSEIFGNSVTGDGERILPAAVIEKFVAGTGGALEPLTSGSTWPIAQIVTHAGIVKVRRYGFDMPCRVPAS
jgi:hypothetical protein